MKTKHILRRRAFLLGTVLGAGAWTTRAWADPPNGPRGCGYPRDRQSSCGLTPSDIEGPFYRSGSPLTHGAIAPPHAAGRSLELRGQVRDRGCRPLPGATLDLWQADASGAYDHHGFRFRGRVQADEEGRYVVHTRVPGHYLNGDSYRPAHIHVKVQRGSEVALTTQLYFPGDPHNAHDPWMRPSLLMDIETAGAGLEGRYNFVV